MVPDLIWFDNLRSYGMPNYYVQQLFSRYRGDVVLPVSLAGQQTPSSTCPGLYVSECYGTNLTFVNESCMNNRHLSIIAAAGWLWLQIAMTPVSAAAEATPAWKPLPNTLLS